MALRAHDRMLPDHGLFQLVFRRNGQPTTVSLVYLAANNKRSLEVQVVVDEMEVHLGADQGHTRALAESLKSAPGHLI